MNKLVKREKKLLLPLAMVCCIVLSSMLTASFSTFFIQLLFAVITIPLIVKKNSKTTKLYVIIFVISICFVFLVYLGNQFAYSNPYYIGGSDDLMFEHQGFDVYYSNIYSMKSILNTGVLDRYHNSSFFVLYISTLIRFGNLFDGYNTFIPRIINVYLLIWVTMIFEYFLKKYAKFSDKKANISIIIFALTPNIQYINSHVFRDTFNLLQIFMIVFLFDKLISDKKYMRKVFLLIGMLFLIYMTYYTRKNSLLFAGAISIFIIVEKFKFKKSYIMTLLIPLVILSNFFKKIRFEYFIETYTSYILNIAGKGLSGYVFRQTLFPFGIILRALYAFIIPFPYFFTLFQSPNKLIFDLIMFLIYCGTLIQILFIPFILKRLLKCDWLVLSFLACFLGIIATTFTFRHIILYHPFIVAIGIDGYLLTSKKNRIRTLFFSGITAVALATIYIALKVWL